MALSHSSTSSASSQPWQTRTNRRRSYETREQQCYFLAILEDKESAAIYLKAFQKRLNTHNLIILVEGCGKSNATLIKKAENLYNQYKQHYAIDKTWIFFDKDNLPDVDFNTMLSDCRKKQFHAVWSNPCFELWYLLHFQDVSSGLNCNAIYKKLQSLLHLRSPYSKLKGQQGESLHVDMAQKPKEIILKAIARAKKCRQACSHFQPSASNPCTQIDTFIEACLGIVPLVPEV